MDIVHQTPVLNTSFQDFRCTNIDNHLIGFKKTINMYLKAKNTLHTTRIYSFKYVFIVFFEKKSDAKIYNTIKCYDKSPYIHCTYSILFILKYQCKSMRLVMKTKYLNFFT